MRRVLTFVLVILFLASARMTYDNVLADVEPTKALAEAAACRVKSCKERHGLTRTMRRTDTQTFDYTWSDGVVTVDCHREWYVYGEMKCTTK